MIVSMMLRMLKPYMISNRDSALLGRFVKLKISSLVVGVVSTPARLRNLMT